MNTFAMTHQIPRHRRQRSFGYGLSQAGFTLIEILIAVLVLSFGLLGLAMLQATGLKYNTDSYMRTQATLTAYSIMDRIRANVRGAENGDYVASASPGEICGAPPSGVCADETYLARFDLTEWYAMQQAALGQQTSTIDRALVNTTGGKSVWQYNIHVNWTERDTPFSQTWVLQICKFADQC